MRVPSTTKTLTITTGTAAVGAALILMGSQGLPWANHAEAEPRQSHIHAHDGLTWPPQPHGIGNVVIHSNITEEVLERSRKQTRLDRLEQKTKADMRAVYGLGNRFTRVAFVDQDDKADAEEGHRKSDGTVVSRLVYFSHDKNVTVDVGFDAEETLEAVTVTPAKDYQPEITDEEIQDAEQLARAYFLRQGSKRIAGLRAYGILAYKPDGTRFYDTRVVYVSFQKDDDAPPQLMAWVDLTKQQILEVREEL